MAPHTRSTGPLPLGGGGEQENVGGQGGGSNGQGNADGQGQGQGGVPCTIERFIKLQPPAFEGLPDPLKAEAWLSKMRKIFQRLGCTDADKVSFATYMLEGEADQWWESTERTLAGQGIGITWARFLECFNEKYFPQSLREQKEVEFIELEQGTMSVVRYEAKFTELSRFAPHEVATEIQKVKKFQRGLNKDIRKSISILRLQTYAEVVDRALIAERDNEEEKVKEVNQSRKRLKQDDKVNQESNVKNEEIGTSVVCARCGNKHGNRPCYMVTGACFKCGKIGHRIKDCPSLEENNKMKSKETSNAEAISDAGEKSKRVFPRVYSMVHERETRPSDYTGNY